MKGLARKGHQVDVISAIQLKQPYPNYTDIIHLHSEMQMVSNSVTYQEIRDFLVNAPNTINTNTIKLCEALGQPEILNFIRNPPKDPPYDLIIVHVSN